ncbi:hypothetical protein [Pseudovibrio sp. Tun.PSC04-5.I4]|uniref:hypothetical protein n=1 Tax=Pseudovibrio sp. Tun.PSC04-5.I4 TaxID=1798213 RepID=UPI001AD8B67F|nr:hypothetical protein [Pseudovibrio sp. Tun.PSC04-5.I4]
MPSVVAPDSAVAFVVVDVLHVALRVVPEGLHLESGPYFCLADEYNRLPHQAAKRRPANVVVERVEDVWVRRFAEIEGGTKVGRKGADWTG